MIYLFNPKKHAETQFKKRKGEAAFSVFSLHFCLYWWDFSKTLNSGRLSVERSHVLKNKWVSFSSICLHQRPWWRGGCWAKRRWSVFLPPSDITPPSPTQPISQRIHAQSSGAGQAQEPEGEGNEEEECKRVTAPRPSGSRQEATCAYSAAFPAARRRYGKKKTNQDNKLLTGSASKERLCMRIPHWLWLCWV